MTDSQLLEQLAATDAYAPRAPLPSSARTRDAAIAEIERSTDMPTDKISTPQAPQRRIRQGWLAAAAAFVVVLIVGAAMVFLAGQGDEDVIELATTTSAVPTTITTLPPPPVPPMVDGWQRVGGAVMGGVVGTLDMTQAGSRLVVVGFDPGEDFRQDGVIFASDDGVNWTRLAEDDPALTQGFVLMYAVTEGGPGLVAVGFGFACEDDSEECSPYATAWTSVDGTSWTRTAHDPAIFGDLATETTGMTDVIATSTGTLIAVGWLDDWTLDDSGNGESVVTSPAVWTSPDGIVWEQPWLGEGFELTVDVWNDVLTPPMRATVQGPDGGLVAVGAMLDQAGESTAAVWTSQDGSAWDRVDPTSPVFGQKTEMTDITWGSDGYVAVGTEDETTPAIWTSPDGHAWARVDVSDQPFEIITSLGAVAALESGYITVGPWGDDGGGVTVWTSPDGTTWDRVHTVGGEGIASAVVVADGGIAVSGSFPGADNVHAAVWVGPLFDPEAPPPDPGPPPEDLGDEGEEGEEGPPFDPETIPGTDVVPIDDLLPPSEDGYATTEAGEPRLAVGQVTTLPDSIRLDFFASWCPGTTCYRDANFVHPDDSDIGGSYWIENTPFHVRHGFINESEAPLGDQFDAVLFITRQDGPESADGSFELGQPYRFDTDYALRGTTAKCGPGYWEQTEPQTCEWFVHDFAEGIPAGRYDFWTGWYAPCSAWLDLGLVESCANPDEVTWEFNGSVNTPIFGEDYTEGWFPGPFEPETLLSDIDNMEYWGPIVRGWPSD